MAEQREPLGPGIDTQRNIPRQRPLELWSKGTRFYLKLVVQLGIVYMVLVLQACKMQEL